MKNENRIEAKPAKRFFVEMLTRDIDLDDAILDLIDNSLDGLLRVTKANIEEYKNHTIEININKDKFEIKDNCGGIPTKVAQEYAFRMGRPVGEIDNDVPTIGMYGIGMKRAVFKMGTAIKIVSQNDERCFSVDIPNTWLQDDDAWELEMNDCTKGLDQQGTIISVESLYPGISTLYSDTSDFIGRLMEKISIHYAFVLKHGFNILINEKPIVGKEISLLIDNAEETITNKKGILPFVYKENDNGLEITIICGLADAPPSLEEDMEDAETAKVNRMDAGWTIICNDRVVLYADRTRLTGWGDGLPQFHYQFNTLIGIVSFKSNIASKLPVTTTKRGVDASSDVYLRIRRRMIEGMRLFVDYTNKWKNKRETERQTILPKAKSETLDNLIDSDTFAEKMVTVRDGTEGKLYKPKLPEPDREDDGVRTVKYSEHKDNIEKIAEDYFENKDLSPSDVGKKCFEVILAQVTEDK